MTDGSLERSSGVMALGTLASRVTGFLRIAVLAAVLGITVRDGLADPYHVANTTPNIVYELLLGGILTSVVVPLLVRTAREDADGGDEFAQTFLTLVTLVLGGAALVGIVAAPALATALGAEPGAERAVTTTLLRWFLPQIVCYGIGATVGGLLNARGRFAAPMAAPVLNNLVVIATGLAFAALTRGTDPRVDTVGGGELTLLGAGTTLGVVAMTVALLPSLRRSGFRWRWRLCRHPALRDAVRLGGWVLVYVLANQAGLFVILRLAQAAVDGGYTAYQYAFLLFQLPHAIVTVSVITALVPRLAGSALDRDRARLRADLGRGARLVVVVVVPAAFGYLALAGPICSVVFRYGRVSADQAGFVADVLPAFAVGLVSFSAFQLLLRAFYATADSRTPALVNLACNAVNVAADLALFALLDGRSRVVGLAAGHAIAYTFGAVVLARLLSRRIGGLELHRVARTAARAGVAGAAAAAAASGIAAVVRAYGGSGPAGSFVAVAVAVPVAIALYVTIARRLHVTELDALRSALGSRLGGRRGG